MSNEPVKPRRRDGVLSTQLIDELVIYDPVSFRAASLNATARAIWQLCDGTRTIEHICGDLEQQYNMSADRVRHEITEKIVLLLQLGLLCE
jgi:hypothetical protein